MHNFSECIKQLQNHTPEYLAEHGIDVKKPFKCPNPQCGAEDARYVPARKLVVCPHCGQQFDIVDLERLNTGTLKVGKVTLDLFAKYGIEWVNDRNIEAQYAELNKDAGYREKELYFMRSELNISNASHFADENGINMKTIRSIPHAGVDNMQRVSDAEGRKVYHPALIIPTNSDHTAYITVDMVTLREYRNSVTLKEAMFGLDNLYDTDFDAKQCVYVVESMMDCIAIMEAGGRAVALQSPCEAQINTFIAAIGSKKPKHPLVVALRDRTESDKASETLTAYCKEARIECYHFTENTTINSVYGSPLQALKNDRNEFIKTIQAFNYPQRFMYIEQASGKNYVSLLEQYAEETKNLKPITTGLPKLNETFGGGLRPYLYVIGGRTGSGKSALTIQIANEIAKSGKDVMYVTLEVSRNEIVARIIADIIKHKIDAGELSHICAVSENDIMFGDRRESLPPVAIDAIHKAEEEFTAYSPHLFIIESVVDTTVSQIVKAADDHTKMMGHTPVIIVDYLQALKKEDKYASDKESIDYNIHTLKALARKMITPVICLTSYNRLSNSESAVSESAGAGSGQIEYTADVLASWQQRNHELSYEEWRKSCYTVRDMELFILKNRHGDAFTSVPLDYYPVYNYIIESDDAPSDKPIPARRTAEVPKNELKKEVEDALSQAAEPDSKASGEPDMPDDMENDTGSDRNSDLEEY